MKRIGLLGGISAASTRLYYTTILDHYYAAYGDYYYPEILINSLNFQYFTDLENQGRTEEYTNYISAGIKALEAAGADFVAMTANSPHSVFQQVSRKAAVPMVSIVDAVGSAIQRQGIRRVLLTGIKYTMQHSFYQTGLEQYGVTVVVPGGADQNTIEEIIFGELVLGRINQATRARLISVLDNYPVDGVILGCTELPLLLQSYTKPLFDSLDIHCRAILDFALQA